MFALHACGGEPRALLRGQGYLLAQLPRLKRLGFIDGLLEALLMLRKMEVEIPGEAEYLGYLQDRINADGSICRFEHPGCRGDWHASALLLALHRTPSNRNPGEQTRSLGRKPGADRP